VLTPQQEQLNNQICELPVIKDLQENDKTFYQELEKFEKLVEDRFDKGSERMDGIEDELKKLSDTIRNGLSDVITEIRDHKITDLTSELKIRKAEGSTLKTGLILLSVASALSAIGYLILKAFG